MSESSTSKAMPLALLDKARAKPPGEAADAVFAQPWEMAHDFKFGSKTAAVFDDMVSRSVPYYEEIQRMVCELAADFAVPGTALYDLGCATGTTLHALDARLDPGVRFVGIDNSQDMLDKARGKLDALASGRQIDLTVADLNDLHISGETSVFLMVLTLQFVRPLHRERLIRRCCESMDKYGALILVEKTISAHGLLNRLFIEHYYGYKRRNGYSELEISQKREALENVLVPYRYEENRDLLRAGGFSHVDEFFRWYNFCGIIAVK